MKSETDSLVLMYNQSVLRSDLEIGEVSSGSLGVVRLTYVSIETMG